MSPHSLEKCPYCGEDRILLTVNEATEIASVNRKTIYRWIRTGTLEHCVLPSGSIRIFKDSLIRPPGGSSVHAHPEAMVEDQGKDKNPRLAPKSVATPLGRTRPGKD